MSAVATAEVVSVSHPAAELAPVAGASVNEIEAAEQKRWMIFFGLPALVASIFLGITFATGQAWWLGLAITAIVFDIFVLVWLAMSSDTNGLVGEPASAAR
jgi:hypothetical protein